MSDSIRTNDHDRSEPRALDATAMRQADIVAREPGAAPLLSVIVPCFNAADFLRETVASLNAQTYGAIEIILVNDGSSDGTANLVDALESESRSNGSFPVRAIHQPNGGPSVARNTGIMVARGAYIGFLDADDRWHKDKAATQIALMEQDQSIALTCSGWRIIREDGQPTARNGGAPAGTLTLEALLYTNLVATTSNVIARAGVLKDLGGFEPTMRHAEDLDLWLRIAAREGTRIVSTGTILIDRRERPGQLTKQWVKMYDGWLVALERIRAIEPARVARVARAATAMNERYCAFLAYEAQDFEGARKVLLRGWLRDPLGLLAYKRTYLTTLAVLATYLPRNLHDKLVRRARSLRETRKL